MNLSTVEEYIVRNGLLQGGEKVIVGVSGGADSVALLDILHSFKIECVVAHCNFHLRGQESNRDAFFVEELCQKYNLKFERIDFDTEAHAAMNSISIEMAARELRYNWFEQLRVIHLADKIAIAHHRDDSVETILLNLIDPFARLVPIPNVKKGSKKRAPLPRIRQGSVASTSNIYEKHTTDLKMV